MGATVDLTFVAGTLEIRGLDQRASGFLPSSCLWDDRTDCHRMPAVGYAPLVLALRREGIPFTDGARRYQELDARLAIRRKERPYQTEALQAWRDGGRRGQVVLPTGSGKSYLALMAIDQVRRDTLVVAPTLDLVAQWARLLKTSFRCEVGVVGGGEHTVHPLSVTTYDSAMIHMEHLGARFGFVVFDECHHLPGESYSFGAQMCLAPFRLGLTATPERPDGRHEDLVDLIGPVAYRKSIGDLAGEYLSDYTVETILVDLTDEERADYDRARKIYRDFVVSQGISMRSPDGWSRFVMFSSMSPQGREAMCAYQEQKRIAFAAPSKIKYVDQLLHKHRGDRVLMFTERNDTAYQLAMKFLIPIITHQTKVPERLQILERFGDGTYNAIVTSKVLNEGVDLPSANVGVIVSGSGSVREHVQRLGRILRKGQDKMATLYELVSDQTAEMRTSSRRREHDAYS